MACLERLLCQPDYEADDGSGCRHGECDSQWIVDDRISIADFLVFDIVDLHLTYFEAAMRQFEALCQHHKRVAGQPGVLVLRAWDW